TNGNLKWTITSISDKFEVKEYPDGREEITKYYFVNDQLIAKKNPDGTKEYSHNDHLGSTNLTTDQSGQKIEETQYDPRGEVKAGSSVVNAVESSKTTSNKPSRGGSSSNNDSKIPNGNNFDKISRILPFIPQNKDEKIFSGFTTVNKALGSAQTWLGDKYSEIAPNVFRSADNLRQFRMTSITGDLPHVN